MTHNRSLVSSAVTIRLTVTGNDVVPAENAAAVDCPTEINRDKSGTRGDPIDYTGSQVQMKSALTGRCSLEAERGGFDHAAFRIPMRMLHLRCHRWNSARRFVVMRTRPKFAWTLS